MLRVLHCIYDDVGNPWLGGGAAHRVREIYARLADRVEAVVATGSYPGAKAHRAHDVLYRPLGARRPYAWSRLTYAAEASRLLRAERYDVALFDFSVYTPIRVPTDRPVVHVVHMPIGPTAAARWGRLLGRVVEWRERAMLGRARRVETTSTWMARRLEPLVAPGTEIRVVPTGVDDAFFAVARREADYLLYYGRFDIYQKGLDVLVGSIAPLLRDRAGLRLVLAGRGRGAADVARLVEERQLSGRVEIVTEPSRERVLELLSGALLLLHPSRFEGLPAVPMEAMAAGVPVVATAVGALDEIVEPRTGLLVPPGEADALVDAAAKLIGDPATRHDMSLQARQAARRFTWQRVAELHLEFLAAVALHGPSTPPAQRNTS